GYPIDGILRIGGVPTFRPWRGLEDRSHQVSLCSLSHLRFSGVSWNKTFPINLSQFLKEFPLEKLYQSDSSEEWLEADRFFQISTFLGMACPGASNWGIFGDFTMLYDFAGPWILNQLSDIKVTLVVINNGGGKIFSRIYPQKEIQNCHSYSFEHFAKHWRLEY